MAKKVWTAARRKAFAAKMKRARAAAVARRSGASARRRRRARPIARRRSGNPSGIIVQAKREGGSFMTLSRDGILSTSTAAARRFKTVRSAVSAARAVGRELGAGWSVYIERP
jgi:hypothetical protein